MSGMTVRRIEAGYTPFLSTQAKFARDMDVQIDELFGMPTRTRRPRLAEAAA